MNNSNQSNTSATVDGTTVHDATVTSTEINWLQKRLTDKQVVRGNIIEFTTTEIAEENMEPIYSVSQRDCVHDMYDIPVNYDMETAWEVTNVEYSLPPNVYVWKKFLPISDTIGVVRIYLHPINTESDRERCMWCINVTHGCISDINTGRPLAYLGKIHKLS